MKTKLTPRILTILLIMTLGPITAIMVFPSHVVVGTPMLTRSVPNSVFNSSMWKTFQQGTGPSSIIANQSLFVTLPASSTNDPTIGGFGAGIGSLCLLRGDFDI